MKTTTSVRLFPAHPDQLLRQMRSFNAACNELSVMAFEDRLFGWLPIQKKYYRWLRDERKLNSNQATLAVRKVAYAYSDKAKRSSIARFRELGAVPIYHHSYKKDGTASFWGLRIPFAARQDINLSGWSEAKLTYTNGKFVLHQTLDVEAESAFTPKDWLGCDLGVVNILSDSDGDIYSGAGVDEARRKFSHRRRNLQRNGSRSAKRKLQKLSGKQARYQRDVNHVISRKVVAKAKDTRRGIALENLKGIRKGITVRKAQRARLSNWSFFQLRKLVSYKAELVGVPVVFVDPRNTSRECPQCGYTDKKNRQSQSSFKCLSCGFAGLADKVAARNVRARALGDTPMVAALC